MTAPPRFDELIHAPTRLSIVALLGASDWAEFRFLRDTLSLSDSALSKQLTVLEGAGYVEIRKAFVGKRPRTWARLSRAGRHAFEGHVQKLREIVAHSGVLLDGDTRSLDRPDPQARPDPNISSGLGPTVRTSGVP
jgi:DNA-binding transcriptional ArsR family regulator